MKLMKTGSVVAILLAACILAPAQTEKVDVRTKAADLLGVSSADLEDAVIHQVHFRTLDRRVTIANGVLAGSDELLRRCIDVATGEDVDFASLRALEIQAREVVPGAKIEPSLATVMGDAAPEDRIRVIAWLHFDGATLDRIRLQATASIRSDTLDEVRAAEAEATHRIMQRNADVVTPVVELLRGTGISVRYASTTAPVLCLSANPGQIEILAGLPEIDTLYLEGWDSDDNVDAHESHRTYRVHESGVKGLGTRVAVLEDNGIDPACPHLNVAGWFNSATPNPDDHVHGTAGCIASRLPSRIGGAPDVTLYSANADSYSDTDVIACADWIATTNIDVTNMSYGGSYSGAQTPKTRYFDYQSRYYQDSYVGTAGNTGLGSFVGSPGSAWNLITAGSFDNIDTGDWVDDGMSSFSATQDPTSGCEKPNLVAVGNTVDTLADGTVNAQTAACAGINQPAAWLMDNFCGTSFSAPYTTAALANAMSVDSTVVVYPEAAMALMMATAWHNIEGSSRLSDQDGAGGLHALAAYRAAAAGHAVGANITASSFSTNGYYTYNIQLKGADRTRVCIAWSAKADSGYTTTSLDANLNLRVYAGQNTTSGTYLGTSYSSSNNFEIVEFTPPADGWYTVRVDDITFAGTSEILGIAWSQKYADTSCARLREFGSESNPTGPTLGQQYYYMDVDARNSPGLQFLAYPSATLGDGFPLGTHHWSPLSWDIFTDLWFDNFTTGYWFWNNSVGTLNSSGRYYSNRMALPNVPILTGWPLNHVAVILDPYATDGIKELSEVHTFTFWPAPLNLLESDDGSITQNLPFGFKFYGVNYTQCHVNMNGNVTFGSGDSNWVETAASMLSDEPRIAGMWHDLGPHQASPSQSDTRVQTRQIYSGLAQALVVEFINVPRRTSSTVGSNGDGANTFRIILHADNSITFAYRDCSLVDCLVGISPGGGISSATEKDLTSSGRATSGSNQALFQYFEAGEDLDLKSTSSPYPWYNTLRFVPTSSSATNYRLEVDVE